MPRKMRIEDELTRTRTGKELSPWLLKLMGDRALPLAPRSLIHMTLPPLAFYVWHQLDYLREKSSRMVRWVSDHTAFTLPRATRLPALSPAWQRLLAFIWFRRYQKRRNEPLQAVYVTDEERLINDTNLWADELYANELLQTIPATEEEQLVNMADELYPIVIKNLLSPPMARMELPDITDDFFHQTDVTSVHRPARKMADRLEAEDTGRPTTPPISQIKIPGIYGANRGQVKDAEDMLVQANWQPEPAYQSRWSGKVWAPLTRYIARLPHLSYLMITRARAEPTSQATQHPTLPYIDNTTEVMTQGGETIETVESYYRLVNLEKESNLLYSLPNQIEPAILRAMLKRPSPSHIPRATGSLNELVFKSLLPDTLTPSKDLGLLPARVTSQRAAKISQARWSILPMVNPWPEIAGQRAETTNISENSGGMTHSPVTATTLDKVSLGQGLQTDQAEVPLIHRESLSIADSPRQPLSITESIYQTPALPVQRYFKSVGNAPPPEESENFGFLWNQDHEPSSLPDKETHQSALEQLIPPVAGLMTSSNAIHKEGSLSAIFEGATYYGSQLVPELALAPVGRSTETVSPPPPKPEVKVMEDTNEVAAPDIDAIARDVYCILRRRLAREKERALGLS